ncbi:MAG TPA: hypothetical protein VJ044_18180, partial [Candidatus Hodarchaeales archaeon]|nr:hypothetical protein [Candidatus Hodarchaeales archaeon]
MPVIPILKILIIEGFTPIYSYTPHSPDVKADDQMLSGLLSALKTFGSELGSEISSLSFRKLQVYYRILQNDKKEFILVFLCGLEANEEDVRIRMELFSQTFVRDFAKRPREVIAKSAEESPPFREEDRTELDNFLRKVLAFQR